MTFWRFSSLYFCLLFCVAAQDISWVVYQEAGLSFRYPPTWELIPKNGQLILRGPADYIITPAAYEELGLDAGATSAQAMSLFLEFFTTGASLQPITVPAWSALDLQVLGDEGRTLLVLKVESGDFVFIAATTEDLGDLIPLVLSLRYEPPRNPLIPMYLKLCRFILC